MSNTQHMRLYKSKLPNDNSRWLEISTKYTFPDGTFKFVKGKMSVMFSNKADKLFNDLCHLTDDKSAEVVDAGVTKAWLKARTSSSGASYLVMFIDEFETWNPEKL